ncbi:MAG: alcohol dehydrogenase catalytic domain-containing protein [Candidatus Borkfalkiaceae bacterium]|nr:alcohol dehydrogenase catalytic domain-containing protein [Christensenellaceae bacterium]
MKAVVWRGDREIEYTDYPEPQVKDNEVKLKVLSCGYCVTEYHIMTGKIKLCEPPHVLGHEVCGQITEVGNNVEKEIIGRRVVVETYVGCGECEYCKNGQKHLCDAGEIGYPPYQGGEAEFVSVPRSCVHFLPDEITDDEAGIMEAAVCPFGAIMENEVKGKTVLVYGAGVAGLSFMQAAKVFGARKVICVVRNDLKKEQAYHFGADIVIDSRVESVADRVKEETYGYGADFFADATGAKSIIEQGFTLVRKGGKIILYGLPDKNEKIELPVFDVILNQISLCGYTGNSKAWEELISKVKQGKFNLKDMITMRLPLKDTAKAMEILDDKPADMIKIVLKP